MGSYRGQIIIKMSGKITIKNQSPSVAVIEIEGIIGVPEEWQFDDPGQRVATYETFRGVIDSIKSVSAPEIIVNIRSTGGNVNDALMIFDALTALKSRITTRCYGYVASAATIIAQAASPGQREISANSLYLIHRSACAAEGNAEQMAQTVEMLDKTDDRIASVYASRSGKPVTQFAALMAENNGNGRWLSPKEVVENSLADRIIGSAPITDNAKDVVANMGLPPIPKIKDKKSMNLTKQWNAILDILGISQAEIDDRVNEAPVNIADLQTIQGLEAAQSELMSAHCEEVATLTNRIAMLEADNARLSVKATATQPKEDPSAGEAYRSPNEMAYYQDIKNFN